MSIQLGKTYSPTEDGKSDYDLLPVGVYTATITSAEQKATKSGTGHYLNMAFTISGPTHQGRVVFDIFNLWNSNTVAVEIAEKTFADMLKSAGLPSITETGPLIGCMVKIKIGIQPDKSGQYEDKNRIKRYFPADAGSFPAPQAPTPPNQASAPQQPVAAPQPAQPRLPPTAPSAPMPTPNSPWGQK